MICFNIVRELSRPLTRFRGGILGFAEGMILYSRSIPKAFELADAKQ